MLVRRIADVLSLVIVFGSAMPLLAGPPPGGGNYFGNPENQQFTPAAIFTGPTPPRPPAPPPPPPPPPVIGEGADGGLLPIVESPPPPKIWFGSGEIGANGASGNSELFNLRIGWNAMRKTDLNVFTTDFTYTYTHAEGLTNTNQAILNARDEMLFLNSKWSLFAATVFEYDQLREYDLRTGVYGGAGYALIDDEFLTFKLRGGAGAVYETSTRTNLESRWVPELVFGYDFRYTLSERSSFLSTLDYFPRIDDFSQFRVRARMAYEHVLDPATATVLRLGLQNRYDSDPGPNSVRNDLTYFATLGVKF